MRITLTVCFEEPYWIGVFEKVDDTLYSVAKVIFGDEPTTPEVYEMVINDYNRLDFSRPLEGACETVKKVNPKRMQREINHAMKDKGMSTKAQQAMKLEIESRKQERKALSKEQKRQIEQEKFTLRMQKKKEKKKGH